MGLASIAAEVYGPRLTTYPSAVSAPVRIGTCSFADEALVKHWYPKGLPASELDAGQREMLRSLLAAYLGRVPDGLSPQADYQDDAALDAVHLAWAGPTGPGQPHYYRLQGPRLLIEYDNTQRHANHAHSVWRDPAADFGYDALGAHLEVHHPMRA